MDEHKSDAAEADVLEQRDPIAPEPQWSPPSDAPDAPEADALDQARPVHPAERFTDLSLSPGIPEADALEQAWEVPIDDEENEQLPPDG